jgi:hypothetical protein
MAAVAWYRQDKEHVAARLQAGERPDMAMTTATGPLDELVALHDELGALAVLERVGTERQRAGLQDRLLLRTLAALPFVGNTGFGSLTGVLFREPAVLLRLGWSPVQLQQGDNDRHRHPDGRQVASLPCHPDTLRDALARISEQAWRHAQQLAVQGLFDRGLVRGRVYAVDGTGLGTEGRVVALVCVSAHRPLVVAWRYLAGTASEKGREASVTRGLIAQALALGGPGCIRLLLADALYADGPLLAWLKCVHGIDALVRLPEDRLLYQDLQQLAATDSLAWQQHRYLRVRQGHKERCTVALAGLGQLDNWDSFRQAAAGYGVAEATLWACLIREMAPRAQPLAEAWALVSTRDWPRPAVALTAFRSRWVIEDDTFRELKEGWGLERQRWGTAEATVRGRVALTLLAFNTEQVYRTRGGAQLAGKGIRRLRQEQQRELGAAPAVVYVDGRYGVFALEELLALVGAPVRQSVRPRPQPASSRPTAPT